MSTPAGAAAGAGLTGAALAVTADAAGSTAAGGGALAADATGAEAGVAAWVATGSTARPDAASGIGMASAALSEAGASAGAVAPGSAGTAPPPTPQPASPHASVTVPTAWRAHRSKRTVFIAAQSECQCRRMHRHRTITQRPFQSRFEWLRRVHLDRDVGTPQTDKSGGLKPRPARRNWWSAGFEMAQSLAERTGGSVSADDANGLRLEGCTLSSPSHPPAKRVPVDREQSIVPKQPDLW